jgi:malonyl-CoA/methylmalonyl-CoA synthetase
MTSMLEALIQVLRRAPERLVLRFPQGGGWSAGELDTRSGQLASALVALGVVPGDRVAAQVEKSPEALALYLASLRCGAVFLPLNPAYREGELGPMLQDSAPRVVVADPSGAARLAGLVRDAAVVTLARDGRGSLVDASLGAGLHPVLARAASDPAALLYTSGTTGRPKGAVLTHGNLLSNARVLVEAWGFTERDVLVHALPIFHVHGLFVACHTALLAGATMSWHGRFDAAAVLADLARATVLMGVPTFYTRLLEQPGLDREAVAGMRLFISGSAPLLAETHRAFEARTGHRILERYGMTEILMHCSNPLRGERRPGSVGPPLPGCEVRILDDQDRDLPVGATGQVAVRGPNVFAGYWNLPERTRAEHTADGWFRTGDLGFLSPDGYLTLVGRAKDVVITGGLNVYPIEVETVLDAVPGVLESAVIGLPDPDLGESVTAVVVRAPGPARPDEAALIAAAKTALAGFKVPRRVVFVDELPRNAMGKVQKAALRAQLAADSVNRSG